MVKTAVTHDKPCLTANKHLLFLKITSIYIFNYLRKNLKFNNFNFYTLLKH